jgi:hypothetical protein
VEFLVSRADKSWSAEGRRPRAGGRNQESFLVWFAKTLAGWKINNIVAAPTMPIGVCRPGRTIPQAGPFRRIQRTQRRHHNPQSDRQMIDLTLGVCFRSKIDTNGLTKTMSKNQLNDRRGRIKYSAPMRNLLKIKVGLRKGGLEPPRSCDRQPLKLVRLPIPPLPHGELEL